MANVLVQILCLSFVLEGLKDFCQIIQLLVKNWKNYQNMFP